MKGNKGWLSYARKYTNLKDGYVVRYADDFKIMCRNYTDAQRYYHATIDVLKSRLKLDISPVAYTHLALSQMVDTKRHFGKLDKRQGYHFILSFEEDEVSEEEAFQVVGEFVTEFLGKDFEAVYAVHNDTDHIHGHIIFNSVRCTTVSYTHLLCGYDWEGTWKADFWAKDIRDVFIRIEILMRYKCLTYLMRYAAWERAPEIYKGMYINLSRWCNQPAQYSKKSLREFCTGQGEYSSCFRYLTAFEALHPEMAHYLDMKDVYKRQELVYAEDLTIKAGEPFDLETDYRGFQKNDEKVKVTFLKAEGDSGNSFDFNTPGSYQAFYCVDPLSGSPSYQMCIRDRD